VNKIILKSTIRVLGIISVGVALIIAVAYYQKQVELREAESICESIKGLKKHSEILLLAEKDGYFIKSIKHSTKVSKEEYSCFCLYTHDNDNVVNNYGALCYD